MSSLRCSLIRDWYDRDWKGETGMVVLCILVSVWLHLLFFMSWSWLDGDPADNFYFKLESYDPPALELTLIMNAPVQAAEDQDASGGKEIAAAEVPAGQVVETIALNQAELDALAAILAEEGGTGQSLEVAAEELARTELVPSVPAADQAEANSRPPVRVEAEAPKFKSYYTAIRSAVARRWIMPPNVRDQFRPGRLTADFTIGRNGRLLRIVVIESSGNASLDHAGLEALRSAAPFPPFPEELQQYSQLDIRMHFDYQAQYVNRLRRNGGR